MKIRASSASRAGRTRFCYSDYDRKIALVVKRIEPAPDQRQIIAVARLIKDHGADEFFKIRASTERSSSCPNIARFVLLEGQATRSLNSLGVVAGNDPQSVLDLRPQFAYFLPDSPICLAFTTPDPSDRVG